MIRAPAPFPRLLFGNDRAEEIQCAQAYGDRMLKILSALDAYDALGDKSAFRAKTCSVEVGDLVLTANACTPVHMGVAEVTACNLMIPLAGRNVSIYEQKSHVWENGQSAMYFPAVGRHGSSDTRSVLSLRFDPRRLQEMVGHLRGDETAELLLDRPRLLSLNPNGVSLLDPLRHFGALIDSLADQPQLAAVLNLDDTIYRWMALLFSPDSLLPASPEKKADAPRRHQGVDRACDYALAHLETGLTLTDMEREARMSRRSLQYAFAERFGLTPMAWIRQQRLAKARLRLQNPQAADSVTHIALAAGFAKPSLFAQYYRQAYGEAPSETLRKNAMG